MNVRRFLFLFLGLARAYPRTDRPRRIETSEKLLEPQGSKNCRRNIIVLSATLTLAGLAGADPHTLSLFGVKPSADWGFAVLYAAAVAVQIYWYVQRFQHLSEDGILEKDPVMGNPDAPPQKISWNPSIRLVRKEADFIANWVAVLLTLLSWCFITSWILNVSFW